MIVRVGRFIKVCNYYNIFSIKIEKNGQKVHLNIVVCSVPAFFIANFKMKVQNFPRIVRVEVELTTDLVIRAKIEVNDKNFKVVVF